MNKKQIQGFINDIFPELFINIKFYNKKDGYVALADSSCNSPTIYVNTYTIKKEKYSNFGIKGIILHELGHILLNHSKNSAKNELDAQLFALIIADELGMVRVFRRMLLELFCWGISEISESKISYNSYRLYYDAYRLFLKDKKLVRKYAKKYKMVGRGLLYDLKNPPPKKLIIISD